MHRDWRLSFDYTNLMLITTDEFTYVLSVRLRSPPVNDRVENGVRRFYKRVPYFTDHHYTGVLCNYYANPIEEENNHFQSEDYDQIDGSLCLIGILGGGVL